MHFYVGASQAQQSLPKVLQQKKILESLPLVIKSRLYCKKPITLDLDSAWKLFNFATDQNTSVYVDVDTVNSHPFPLMGRLRISKPENYLNVKTL